MVEVEMEAAVGVQVEVKVVYLNYVQPYSE